jgi:hypothetical protein
VENNIKVEAVVCPVCEDTIYSRARHDYHYCTCGAVGVDGGREYTKISWDPKKCGVPEVIEIELPYTRTEIYQDWNQNANKLGTIRKGQTP